MSRRFRIQQTLTVVWRVVKSLLGSRRDWVPGGLLATGRPHFRLPSIGVVIAIGSIVVGWWAFAGATGIDDDTRQTFDARPALFAGAISVMAMMWSHILSTRSSLLEILFGGLDRMYRWHRWSGALAVATAFLHTQIVDDIKGIPGASRSLAKAAEELAGIAETVLYILVAASIIRWVPYRWWRHTHKLMYPVYIISCAHFYTASKPFGNGDGWGRFYSAAMIVGILAGAHRLIWMDMIKRGRPYEVSSIRRGSRFVDIGLTPTGSAIRHVPGQFAFLKFSSKGLSEPHPFTIASGSSSSELRFAMRTDGDWTGRVNRQVSLGDTVMVEGAYGRSHPLPRRHDRQVLWIAGGVGITPFLSALDELNAHPRIPAPHLFYAVSNVDEAIGLPDLEAAHRRGILQLHLHISDEGSRLTSDDLTSLFGPSGLSRSHVVMCGPRTLLRSMSRAARECGASRIHIEEFDIRSGIGPDLTHEVDDIINYVTTLVQARTAREPTTR